MTRVIDTSVVVKWIVTEEGTPAALSLVGGNIVAPDLLKAELANAVWKKVRRRQMQPLQAASGFAYATSLLTYAPVAHLADQALAIGLELDHPVYDCFFLALAEELGTSLVTSDQRLIRTCAIGRWRDRVEPLA